MLPAGLALLFDLLEPRGQRLDALAEQSAVGFELRFAGTTIADATTALALEVGPAAHQARGDVFELRQLHFELAFVAARALREDVEDQSRAIEHAALDELLEIAFLRGRQRMIEQDDVGVVLDGGRADFIRLAAADEEARIGTITPAADAHHGNGAGGARERSNSWMSSGSAGAPMPRRTSTARSPARGRSNNLDSREAERKRVRPPVNHSPATASIVVPSSLVMRTLRAGTTVEIACL